MGLSRTIFEIGLFPVWLLLENQHLCFLISIMLSCSPVSQGQLVEELKGQETSHGGT